MSLNLVTDNWISYLYRDGEIRKGNLAQLVDPEIIDVVCPRADFYGALYQFLISIAQTIAVPEDFDEWEEFYEQAYSIEDFEQKLSAVTHAFEVFGDGARFMQDLDPLDDIQEENFVVISDLLIGAPGANTIKQNTDHFIKRGLADELSPAMAALALFTLQINAPGGGQGHRTGIRGGGPLTTLLRPDHNDSSLWQKIWLNVRDRESWNYPEPNFHDGSVFPWLAPTKISKKPNTELYAKEVHPLYILWAMPRRIRLVLIDEPGVCALTGEHSMSVVSHYKRQNYGNNYVGKWLHPLTHYRFDPKKPQEPPYSNKAQPSGINYQHWLTLLFDGRESYGSIPAAIVTDYSKDRISLFDIPPRLWVFGFDLDKDKARGWYSIEMPLLYSDVSIREQQVEVIQHMLDLSAETLKFCKTLIKAALSNRPKDLKGDMSVIDANFYQVTEKDFFAIIAKSIQESTNNSYSLSEQDALQWKTSIESAARNLFDFYVISGIDYGQPKKMPRIIEQRKKLEDWLRGVKNKPLKVFKEFYLS